MLYEGHKECGNCESYGEKTVLMDLKGMVNRLLEEDPFSSDILIESLVFFREDS